MIYSSLLEGRNRFGDFYVLAGDGPNGKGAVFGMLRSIFGKAGEGGMLGQMNPIKFQSTPKPDNSGAQEDLMAIHTCRLLTSPEASTVRKFNDDRSDV